MSEPTEHRRHERFPVRVPLYVTAAGRLVRKTVRIESKDISAGGVCFETGQRVPLESQSRVVISKLGDLPDPVVIRGRVAWRQRHPFNGRYMVGVEFTDFEKITREELIQKIEDWRHPAGR